MSEHDDTSQRIFVAGHRGLVGSAIVRRLQREGLGSSLVLRSSRELDLRDQRAVDRFFRDQRPQQVYLAAARVGGIHANDSRPANFLADNLQIQLNVIDSAYRHGCNKLLFLGSSCIYPKHAPQPMPESCLLTGELEPTNQWYAIAKIAGIKQVQAYRRQYGFDAISLMPTNLYGPGDNFDLENSHVLPAILRKCHAAVENGSDRVVLWGSGTPRREFLHVDDLADACLFCMRNHSSEEIVNVGVGMDVSIRELAGMIAKVTGFEGEFDFDSNKPDGTPRKLLDVGRINAMGWQASIPLDEGIDQTYRWLQQQLLESAELRL